MIVVLASGVYFVGWVKLTAVHSAPARFMLDSAHPTSMFSLSRWALVACRSVHNPTRKRGIANHYVATTDPLLTLRVMKTDKSTTR